MKMMTLAGALTLGALFVFAMGGWGMGTHMWGPTSMMGWGGMGLGMGALWLLLIAGLYLVFVDRRPLRGEADRAMEIARERFARGDLTKEEFEDIMKRL